VIATPARWVEAEGGVASRYTGGRAGRIRAPQRSAAELDAAFSFPIEEALGPSVSVRRWT
jgi:hypothetical protein